MPKFCVDIPVLMGRNTDDPFGEYQYLDEFNSHEEALEWCKKMFQCDDEGRIQLISEVATEDEL